TRVVPGSHRWIDERPGPDVAGTAVTMPAGSAMVYVGSLWHGGGANATGHARAGVVLHYAASWVRPVENHVLAVPAAVVNTLAGFLAARLLGGLVSHKVEGNPPGRRARRGNRRRR